MVSIRSTISPTCSPALPTTRRGTSPNSCRGTGNPPKPPALPLEPPRSPNAYGNVAVQAVDESPGAVFKGLVFGTNKSGTFLFVTNFRGATVEVFAPNGSTGYQRVGAFTDTGIPAGYAPFGIHNINGMLFVTYAQQDAKLHDDVPGQGHGFVDVFDTNGNLIERFAQHGQLNSPWGVVQASMAFGDFSSDILVGN